MRVQTDRPAASKTADHKSEQFWQSLPYDVLIDNNFDDHFGNTVLNSVAERFPLYEKGDNRGTN